ncbi:MAG: alpha/beta hydrolase [Silicimonas sp.]|nr:alpha/beta hydrolase [Silicimonas sp.]MBT8426050.1 alpha/beta hydrolase [Silicimonas sp.]NND17679.1 alpha/beta hydrolase [Silicimonas sp.]NND20655.1 alpha/beta hydrolase [Silicimonas sp.]NND42946.1 alpha/beta hydrolase [Silicimonas sp.]
MKDTNVVSIPRPERKKSEIQARAPRSGKVRCISRHGFHNVAYRDWGDKAPPNKILCVHGLTRNAHDFDALAAELSKQSRVICPDLAGRGDSDWLSDPADYNLLQYNMDITVLAAKFGYESFDWIGTSLGGLMGIALAGIENSPIRRLVINDVAPEIPFTALSRVTSYTGSNLLFADLDSVERHLRETLAPFGPMTDDDWAHMTQHSALKAEGGYVMHHDPGIMQNFRRFAVFMHFSLWRYWEKIKCPVLILRGSKSDFLTESLLARMLNSLPQAEAIEFEGIGHTPTLNAPSQIEPLVEWIARSRSDPSV